MNNVDISTNEKLSTWIRKLMQKNELHTFYTCSEWLKLRAEVIRENNNECLHCKQKGKHKRANTVHHVNYVKLHPELALSKYYKDDKGNVKPNLIPLCHDCHERAHGYRNNSKQKELLTEEKW